MELILIPLVAALATLFLENKLAPKIALAASVVQLLVTVGWLLGFQLDGSMQHLTDLVWINSLGFHFKIGVDGLGLLLVLLTNLMVPLIVLSGFGKTWAGKSSLFYGLLLLMQMSLVGVFMALDGLLFYIFWELALIPIYLICGIWGGENRIKITFKFFIYTFVGSLLMLLGLIYVYLQTATRSFDIEALKAVTLTPQASSYVLWAFFAAFAIKMPVFPLHTWQPSTYTNAPAQGTMLLAGIMLKMGIFGAIRWMMPLAPEAFVQSQPIFVWLSIIGVVYAAVIAIQQTDLKRLVAYSSISHVGLIAAGVFTNSNDGLQGAAIQMLAHAINVVGLFFVIDIIETKTGTRSLSQLGGMAKNAPKLAILFFIIVLGSTAVPLTNGFVGEFFLLKSIFTYNAWAGAVAGLTVIFCAVYMLRMYGLAMFGNAASTQTQTMNNQLTWYETTALYIIVALILICGVFPQAIINIIRVA